MAREEANAGPTPHLADSLVSGTVSLPAKGLLTQASPLSLRPPSPLIATLLPYKTISLVLLRQRTLTYSLMYPLNTNKQGHPQAETLK